MQLFAKNSYMNIQLKSVHSLFSDVIIQLSSVIFSYMNIKY